MATNGSEQRDSSNSGVSVADSGDRLPPSVYRRRRVIALVVLLVLVVALIWGISSVVSALTGSSEEPEQPLTQTQATAEPTSDPTVDPNNKFADFTPRPTPSGSAGSPTGSPSASPAAVEECGANLTLTAGTDKQTYPADQEPVLILTMENTGDEPCKVNAGSNAMSYVVTSGSDVIFDSRHCAANGEDRGVTLDPGKTEDARLTWNRTRTAEECPANQPEATAGYYNLSVGLGEQSSSNATFVLE
ncbi:MULTISPECIES: hypothetical protein [unclassified Candidatus Sulfotelmatobacter]|uniref:hypothetical protein n=1 Tax=unclassified Candidatus Sulfotelmatobacter TaxID=2635724 RepID=UPI001688C92C|nr:hypothetical protein [Kocuria sp. cx-116]MBD2762899.1 hypothetical protein [Kocuria sp. cx-116]